MTREQQLQEEERHRIINERFQLGDERMVRLEAEMKKNTEITAASQSGIAEILDIFTSFKGGFKVLGWLGAGAKWVAGVGAAIAGFGAAIAAFYFALKNGGPYP